jgi:hypothetical protein
MHFTCGSIATRPEIDPSSAEIMPGPMLVTGYHCHMLWDCFSVRISGIAALVCLAGCVGPVDEVPFTLIGQPKPPITDLDVCDTAQDCAARLRNLVKNANRDWIGVPQSADGYSNGTRLFAYRGLRRKLTCGELQLAIEDTKAAMSTLEKASYERARALAGEVMRELATEQGKRCNRRADSIEEPRVTELFQT